MVVSATRGTAVAADCLAGTCPHVMVLGQHSEHVSTNFVGSVAIHTDAISACHHRVNLSSRHEARRHGVTYQGACRPTIERRSVIMAAGLSTPSTGVGAQPHRAACPPQVRMPSAARLRPSGFDSAQRTATPGWRRVRPIYVAEGHQTLVVGPRFAGITHLQRAARRN